MSIQPTSMMGPLTQQLSHLSLGSTGTVMSHPYTLISSAIRTVSGFIACCKHFCPVYSGQHSYAGDLHPTVHPSASLQRPWGKKLGPAQHKQRQWSKKHLFLRRTVVNSSRSPWRPLQNTQTTHTNTQSESKVRRQMLKGRPGKAVLWWALSRINETEYWRTCCCQRTLCGALVRTPKHCKSPRCQCCFGFRQQSCSSHTRCDTRALEGTDVFLCTGSAIQMGSLPGPLG